MDEIKRKGSKSIKDIPADILEQLNQGEIESANLVEWLAINQQLLLQNVLKELGKSIYFKPISERIEGLKKRTITTVNEAIGIGLLNCTIENKDTELFPVLSSHRSDAVRCWATYVIGKNENLSLAQIIDAIQPFAADAHFGVREIAWIAVRPRIASQLKTGIDLLTKWTNHSDENIRRFASEATRPRGVWCAHIDELKFNPALALSILEPLKSDKAKYVQDSVANWLNDASKTQPQFVIDLTSHWSKATNTKETTYIVKKAMRTIEGIKKVQL
jgi:3-methyladenine DNA glycosylase AlkC